MKRLFTLLLIIFLNQAYPHSQATRVISLAPDLTETVFAIGGGQKLVGVIRGSDYPDAAKKLPEVGSYLGLDLEKMMSLHPDLIITWGKTFSRQLRVLEKMGIPIYESHPKDLQDMQQLMKDLGGLLGLQSSADKAGQVFLERLMTLRQRYHAEKPTRVFYQVGSYSLVTINRDSWISQMISLCGGENIFANAKAIAPEVSWEAVVALNPQVIINDSKTDAWKKRWQDWQGVSAVKNRRLYRVNPDWVERFTPRMLEGVEQICSVMKSPA